MSRHVAIKAPGPGTGSPLMRTADWIEFQATDETNRITVAAHDELRVTLQWANRYNMAWEDYDLYAFAGSSPESPVIASGTSSHPRPDEYGIAYEYVSIPNNTDSPLTCYLRVKHIRGYMPREMKAACLWVLWIKLSPICNRRWHYWTRSSSFLHQCSSHKCEIPLKPLPHTVPMVLREYIPIAPMALRFHSSTGQHLRCVESMA